MKHFTHEHFEEMRKSLQIMQVALKAGAYAADAHITDEDKLFDLYHMVWGWLQTDDAHRMVVDIDMLPTVKDIDDTENMRMPFDEMFIGFESEKMHDQVSVDSVGFRSTPSGVFVFREEEYSTVIPISRISKTEWIISSFFMEINHDTMRFAVVTSPGIAHDEIDIAKESLAALVPTLASISVMTMCSNVTLEKNTPSRLRIMRAKKHGMTLKPFSVIKLPSSGIRYKEGGIGHHASPALHNRRGHFRTLHRGDRYEKKVWVRPCIVGNPDRGKVDQEYVVRKQQEGKS